MTTSNAIFLSRSGSTTKPLYGVAKKGTWGGVECQEGSDVWKLPADYGHYSGRTALGFDLTNNISMKHLPNWLLPRTIGSRVALSARHEYVGTIVHVDYECSGISSWMKFVRDVDVALLLDAGVDGLLLLKIPASCALTPRVQAALVFASRCLGYDTPSPLSSPACV